MSVVVQAFVVGKPIREPDGVSITVSYSANDVELKRMTYKATMAAFGPLWLAQQVARDTPTISDTASWAALQSFADGLSPQELETGQTIVSLFDIPYGPGPKQKCDVRYSLVGLLAKKLVAFYMHGGAWGAGGGGDKNEAPRIPSKNALAQMGFVVYSLNYTHAINGVFPADISDLKTFLGWHASGHGVGDSMKMSAWGHSTGGLLALLLAMTPKTLFQSSLWPSLNYEIRCCVATSAPVNLTSLWNTTVVGPYGNGKTAVQTELGFVPSTNLAASAAASPVTYVSAGAIPILMQSGALDTLVPQSQGVELEAALVGAGAVNVKRVVLAGADHDLDTITNNAGGLSFAGVSSFLLDNGR